ncbi:MAG TPA: transporter substrate-binding domain-containing protein [Accumulibacter sp.]|nr:transporter substrate-binding domain-containing protein [Accumulibacter sp.]
MPLVVRLLTGLCLLMLLAASASLRAAELELSSAERAWVAEHPVIRMGIDAGYGPYTFVDENGRVQGVAADFMAEIAALLGVRFEFVADLSWMQLMDAVRARQLDAVATVVHLPEREAFLEFSAPYLVTPLVVVTRRETAQLHSLKDLEALRLVLVEGYSSSRRVLDEHPQLRPLLVANPLDGLRAVASGAADAYVGVIGVNIFLAAQNGITNLKVNVAFDMADNNQRFGVRKDWPELAPLLDKAFAAIPVERRNAILQRWVPQQAEQLVRLSKPTLLVRAVPWLLGALALALVAYLVILGWNRQLKRELARRQHALDASEKRQKASVALAHLGHWEFRVADGRILWSDETYRLFGLEPQSLQLSYEELIARVHPDDRDLHDAYLQRMLDSRPGDDIGELWYRLLRPDGSVREVSVRVDIDYDETGKPSRLFGAIQDVTDWRAMQRKLQSQLDELTRWQAVMLGREDRVQELKVEINALLAEHGQPPRYPSQAVHGSTARN